MRTLRIAIGMTVIELVLAFPFALWLAKGCRSQGLKAILLTLLTIPFFLDLSSRTIIWRALLGSNGVVNTVLMELGITSEPVEWLIFTEFSVFFGLAAPYFATMVFPIFLVATLIDDEYLDASRDLGANPLQTLFLVIVPLCLPGVIAGVVFTMVPMMGEWVVAAAHGRRQGQHDRPIYRGCAIHAQLSDRGLPFGLRARDPGCAAGGAHAADPAAGRVSPACSRR